jgi:hypothetical protein
MRTNQKHVPSKRHGDGTGRSLLRMKTPAHRATTLNLQALYSFVVDSGLGSRGVYVGRQTGSDASFVFDPWESYADGVVTNPNMLLAGVIGRGKSALAKSLALRMSAFGVRVYVPGDPKGEWGQVARAVGVEPIVLGRGLNARVNPLDAGPRPHEMAQDEWRREVHARRQTLLAALAETTLDRKLQPVERSGLVVALEAVTHGGPEQVPVLPDVVAALMSPPLERTPDNST